LNIESKRAIPVNSHVKKSVNYRSRAVSETSFAWSFLAKSCYIILFKFLTTLSKSISKISKLVAIGSLSSQWVIGYADFNSSRNWLYVFIIVYIINILFIV